MKVGDKITATCKRSNRTITSTILRIYTDASNHKKLKFGKSSRTVNYIISDGSDKLIITKKTWIIRQASV